MLTLEDLLTDLALPKQSPYGLWKETRSPTCRTDRVANGLLLPLEKANTLMGSLSLLGLGALGAQCRRMRKSAVGKIMLSELYVLGSTTGGTT